MNRVEDNSDLKTKRPWRDALIATTALSVLFVACTLLWRADHPEWAFLLGFAAVWALITISWSNVEFAEQSGTILARIVDHNFENLQLKIEALESQVAELRDRSGAS